jgi:hypothetical protein
MGRWETNARKRSRSNFSVVRSCELKLVEDSHCQFQFSNQATKRIQLH